ncbi:polymorphic toxin-type HINT domain-containing protein [Micromonospora sp. BRA006-A]|nr:polymorphic toxin-type HINT domain-containing protein [Micromonospora sp. BRA006-A]
MTKSTRRIETGEQGPRRVEHVWEHLDDLVELEIGDAVLVTTEDHPFWNRTEREWQRADELNPGDLVLAPDGGADHVGGLRPASVHTSLAFNLTVNGLHTYYVMAGDTPVLVHNDGLTPPRVVQDGIDAFNRGELRQRMTTKMENGRPVRVNGRTVKVPDEFRATPGPSVRGNSGRVRRSTKFPVAVTTTVFW